MSFYDNLYENKKRELLSYALFKNKFIKIWEEQGEFITVNSKRYFKEFRISGDSVGAVEMSKILGSPTLHNDVENSHISYTDIVLNFDKILDLNSDIINGFANDYDAEMRTKTFGKLFYRFNRNEVLEYYFSLVETTTTTTTDADGNETEVETETITRISDDFLNVLALDIAELARVDYYFGSFGQELEIVFDEYVDVSYVSNKIDKIRYWGVYFGEPDEIYGLDFKIPSIEDRIRAYAVEQGVGYDVFPELGLENPVLFGELYWDIEKAKALNPQKFFNLIQKVLDFDSHTKEKYWWRKILVATAVFVVAVAYIYVTSDVYNGFGLIVGYFGSTMNSTELKVIASILSFGSSGTVDGVFRLSNVGYGEAISLLMNVGSLAYSMHSPQQLPKQPDDFNQEEGSSLLYDAPYAIYDAIYDYEAMTSVSVELNLD